VPPGFRIRAISAKALSRNLRWTMTNAAVTTSADSSGRGIDSMFASMASACGCFFVSCSSISGERSMAVRFVEGLMSSLCLRMSKMRPVPAPRSTRCLLSRSGTRLGIMFFSKELRCFAVWS